MGEKWPIQFCRQRATSTLSVEIFYMPQISEGRHAENFFAQKIWRLQPGLNPQTWVPEASMLTTRPLKPLCSLINEAAIWNKWWTPHVQYNSPCDITLFVAESAPCSSSSSQQNMLRMRAKIKRPSWLADSRRNGTMRESTTLYRRDSTRCELSRGRNRDIPERQQFVQFK
jgi:hypothetical protein